MPTSRFSYEKRLRGLCKKWAGSRLSWTLQSINAISIQTKIFPMKRKKQNSMLLKDALECLLSASKANQKSEMMKIKGIEIAFEFTNGFATVAQIEKGKGETIERNMELLRPEDLEEDFEASGQNTHGLLN